MAGCVNKAIIIGHLGKDPDIRKTQDDRAIANFSVATSESWRDKGSGERKERTQWHRVVVFNEALAKVAQQYLKKGSKVYVEGQIENREWTDKDGVKKFTTEIILRGFNCAINLLDKSEGGGNRPPENEDIDGGREPPGERAAASTTSSRGGGRHEMDDEIPFAPEWRG